MEGRGLVTTTLCLWGTVTPLAMGQLALFGDRLTPHSISHLLTQVTGSIHLALSDQWFSISIQNHNSHHGNDNAVAEDSVSQANRHACINTYVHTYKHYTFANRIAHLRLSKTKLPRLESFSQQRTVRFARLVMSDV